MMTSDMEKVQPIPCRECGGSPEFCESDRGIVMSCADCGRTTDEYSHFEADAVDRWNYENEPNEDQS